MSFLTDTGTMGDLASSAGRGQEPHGFLHSRERFDP